MAVSMEWRKSSFSADDANCVEIGWRKSSFSAEDANCVEIAHRPDQAAVRDSKNPEGPYLVVSFAAYRDFIASQSR